MAGTPHRPSSALYTARVDNHGGTSGEVRVHDGPTASPLPTGGPFATDDGYNPEQFLAMAWSTCLGETLAVVLAEHGRDDLGQVSVEVELHRDPAGGYRFVPRALVSIEAMSEEEARPLIEAAHARCPVSKLLEGQGGASVTHRITH
ncbi:OsmC family protein [Brachybacterium sp. AOP43-C2-M15]|uniref:OsmC family protein n=1 Tax=Brachybacterium sp. AOP43-C2-M15 TaxID=3457661 RepID=UPI004034B24B